MARGKARYHWVVVGIGGCKLGGDPGPSPGDSVMALAWPAALATAFRSQLSSQGWVGARPQEDGPGDNGCSSELRTWSSRGRLSRFSPLMAWGGGLAASHSLNFGDQQYEKVCESAQTSLG
ncbi:unnamed protein product [Rangifer tarandus platyrhynchus]|uniref:Uncharacterized protein n=2 Tax=Rangifer tarandus platyrhynchus TaxID=3082113 RepID=A0AC59YWL7_RANTA|nr:unnamed protein product [Rangifer tarandus platyrhynchus]